MDTEQGSWRRRPQLSGRSWTAALAAAWITVTGSAQALIPLAARAFDQFDVAANRPS